MYSQLRNNLRYKAYIIKIYMYYKQAMTPTKPLFVHVAYRGHLLHLTKSLYETRRQYVLQSVLSEITICKICVVLHVEGNEFYPDHSPEDIYIQ